MIKAQMHVLLLFCRFEQVLQEPGPAAAILLCRSLLYLLLVGCLLLPPSLIPPP